MTQIAYNISHRLNACPRCDYALQGLPDSGICPECSQPYGTHELYLYGTALGARQNIWNAYSPIPLNRLWSFVSLIVLGAILFWPTRPYALHDPIFLFCFGLFAAGCIVSLWRSLTDQGSGVVQVRLTPLGVHQGTRGIGPKPYERNMDARLIPWARIKEAQLDWTDDHAEIRLSTHKAFFRTCEEFVHASFNSDREHFYDLGNYLRYWLSQNNCSDALDFFDHHRRPIHRTVRRLGLLLRRSARQKAPNQT